MCCFAWNIKMIIIIRNRRRSIWRRTQISQRDNNTFWWTGGTQRNWPSSLSVATPPRSRRYRRHPRGWMVEADSVSAPGSRFPRRSGDGEIYTSRSGGGGGGGDEIRLPRVYIYIVLYNAPLAIYHFSSVPRPPHGRHCAAD